MTPAEVEQFRDELSTIAVVGGQYRTDLHMDLPAKGSLAAGGRGFVSGAGATIAAGVVSPVPGGTIIGIALSPIGGVIGFFRGMGHAEPADKVEAAEKTLLEAAEKLRNMGLDKVFEQELLLDAGKLPGKKFTIYKNQGPMSASEKTTYNQTDYPGADAVLEIRPIRAGLWGLWTVNPPSAPFVELGIRLIRLRDNKVFIDDIILCAGEERSYDTWAENSDLFVEEIIKCIPRLVEKIVDDTFRVTALSNRR